MAGEARGGRASRQGDWSGRKRRQFLEHLAGSANVAASARHVKLCDRSAYRLREKDAGFRAEWDAALRQGYDRLELMLLARAIAAAEGRSDSGVAVDNASLAMRNYSDGFALKMLDAHRKGVGAAAVAVPADPQAARRRLEAKLDQMEARARGRA